MNTIKTGLYCPICNTEYEIFINIYENPNSMYSITSCKHINLTRYSNENDIIHDLKIEVDILSESVENKNGE